MASTQYLLGDAYRRAPKPQRRSQDGGSAEQAGGQSPHLVVLADLVAEHRRIALQGRRVAHGGTASSSASATTRPLINEALTPSPLNGLAAPAASPTTRNVGPIFGPTEPPNGTRKRVGALSCSPGSSCQRSAMRWANESSSLSRVDSTHVAVGRQDTDADVDRAVTQRDHPAVSGDRVAGGIGNPEVRLDPRFGGPIRVEIRPGGDPVRPVPLPRRCRSRPKLLLAPSATTTKRARTVSWRAAAASSSGSTDSDAPRTNPALDDRRRRLVPHQHDHAELGGTGRRESASRTSATKCIGVVRQIAVTWVRSGDLPVAVDEAHAGEPVSPSAAGSTSSVGRSFSASGVSASPHALWHATGRFSTSVT